MVKWVLSRGAELRRRDVTVTMTLDSGVVLRDRTVGPRPLWVAGAFAEMYPDTVSLAVDAASVLATDEDWDWIAVHKDAVGAAIDHTTSGLLTDEGPWLVCRYAVAGDVLLIATMLDAATGSSRPVGSVVLVATVATIGAHTPATDPTTP